MKLFLTKGYIVPFQEKLETVLSMPRSRSMKPRNLEICNNILSEISHGTYIKKILEKKKIENEDSNNKNEIIMIVLYYDDIEIVNPIGVHRKKHKLGKHSQLLIFYY